MTILDPAIDIDTKDSDGTYDTFTRADQLDVWVKGPDGEPFTGKVWPDGNVYFPDYFQNVTQQWWIGEIIAFYDKVKFDGLWIDMNEPANFGSGDMIKGCPYNKYNNPPYLPKDLLGGSLIEKTLCADSIQIVNGQEELHYNVHSLYGWSESKSTLDGVREATKTRGWILSRSTFIGSGNWAAKWLGDNWSQWSNLHTSIIGMIQFNMFGIPHVGADICGFIGNTTAEMCARWHQLGAFYPFSRNHKEINADHQDPVNLGEQVANITRDALKYRYNFLPILYTTIIPTQS